MMLHLTGRNRCRIETYAGESIHTTIDASTFVASYMTVLCLKAGQTYRYRTVVILPDNIEPDSFRQLRIWLKWKWRDEASL